MALPSIEFAFQPDIYAEEELSAETDYVIDKTLITDIDIKNCRVIASVRAVEYGSISSKSGALLVFQFVFHPFTAARFKDATIRFSFENNVVVRALGPESVTGNESEKAIKSKLYGEFSIGHPPANLTFGAERETEKSVKSMMRIQGSGEDTSLAKWTIHENEQNGTGFPEKFIAAMVVEYNGDIHVSVTLHATVAKKLSIRKIYVDHTGKMAFDGKTTLGSRPEGMVLVDGRFVPA